MLKCKQCMFMCVNKEDYWSHQRKMHIKPEKLLECKNCPFVTEYKHHLEYHLRNHLGSKPYKCSQCDYACVNLSMLRSHLKSHSKSLQYNCADCTYSTKYYHSLKSHMEKSNHSCLLSNSSVMTVSANASPDSIESTNQINNNNSINSSLSSTVSACSSPSLLNGSSNKISNKNHHNKKQKLSKENQDFQQSPIPFINCTNNSFNSSTSIKSSSTPSQSSPSLNLQNTFIAANSPLAVLAQYQQQQQQQSFIPSLLLNPNFLLNPVAKAVQLYLSNNQTPIDPQLSQLQAQQLQLPINQAFHLQMALAAAVSASPNSNGRYNLIQQF